MLKGVLKAMSLLPAGFCQWLINLYCEKTLKEYKWCQSWWTSPQMGFALCAAPDLSSRQHCNILLFPALEKIKDFITCYWPFLAINEQLSALQVFVPFLQGFSPLLGAKDLLGSFIYHLSNCKYQEDKRWLVILFLQEKELQLPNQIKRITTIKSKRPKPLS